MNFRAQRRGLTILGIVALVVVIITAVSMSVSNGNEGFFGGILTAITKPARSAMVNVANTLEKLYGYMYEYDKLEEENASLRMRIAELEQNERDYDSVEKENERLRNLLSLGQRNSNSNYATAKVIAWSASSFSSSFTINKGTNDGLKLNEAVITETGYLVGSVTALTDDTATVTTILDSDSSVGALIYETGVTGLAMGDFSYMPSGLLKLTYYEEGSSLLAGDTVVTSGSSGLYPPGLVIGTVTQVVSSRSGLDDYAIIEPAADITSLSNAYVVTEFTVDE